MKNSNTSKILVVGARPDDLSKTFASLMLTYYAGQEINMQQTLKAFPVKLNSVNDYVQRVMKVSQPVY